MTAGRLFGFHGEVSFWLAKKLSLLPAKSCVWDRLTHGPSRTAVTEGTTNRVILDRVCGRAALLIKANVDYSISDQLSDLSKGDAGNSLGAEIARRAGHRRVG